MSSARENADRIVSIDLLRGIVMVIMALDHVRDYWSPSGFDPLDLDQTTPLLFLTRWITHFCAPVFVFLSGVSAWLYARSKNVGTSQLARFLLTRGLWLVLIEVTVVSFSWQFGYQIVILQVIWAIGCSMIALAGLVYLPLPVIAGIGLAMIFGHDLLDGIAPERFGALGWLWTIVHVQNFIPLPGWPRGVAAVYPLVPWIGVMASGYAFGRLFERPQPRRDRALVWIGAGATVAFVVLRALNVYGDPQPWSVQPRGPLYTVLSFINVSKYPPSLLYLLMTLGPAIACLPLLERWRGAAANVFNTFGRVPFFYYVLHIPLVHATAWVWYWLGLHAPTFAQFTPREQWPAAYHPNLARAYLAWAVTVVALYFPCRWFMALRRRRSDWWLSYL
jgi:uncharacterized membrane protein